MNHKPRGEFLIIGEFGPGQEVLARFVVRDDDRYDRSSVEYQWFLDGEPVPGSTGIMFRPKHTQVGMTLTCQGTYVDYGGTEESVLSEPRKISTGDFLADLYWRILDREPDEEGRQFWANFITDKFIAGVQKGTRDDEFINDS